MVAGLARTVATLTLVLAIGAGLALDAPAAAKRPPGAVKLAKSKQKRVGKVRCGLIKRKWVAGTALKRSYFITHTQQAKNFKKAAGKKKGAKRRALLKKAARFTARAKKETRTCNPSTGGVPNDDLPPGGAPASGAPLKFSVSGVAGLALQAGAVKARASRMTTQAPATGSNLDTVAETGVVKDAVVEGAAVIQKFLIAPNGKLYTVFQGPANVGGVRCILAEVEVSTGVPTCIDSTLQQIGGNGSVGMSGQTTYANPVVQFDSKGSILYTGRATDGKAVLRRYLNGASTDLITDNVNIMNFLVRPDDSVIISGTTQSTGAMWTRRVNPAGGLQTIRNESAFWLYPFPDGNAYIGFNIKGVERFLTATSALDPKPWIAASADAHNDSRKFCADQSYALPGGTPPAHPGAEMCYGSGAFTSHLFSTTDDKVFGVTRSNIGQAKSEIYEYFPTLRKPPTTVTDIRVAQGVITNVVMSGLNATGQNITTVLNTSNDAEKTLIGPESEIEVYHLNYVAGGNKVMFDGLRFADNKYIIGQVTLSGAPVVNTIASGTQKWADLQSFG